MVNKKRGKILSIEGLGKNSVAYNPATVVTDNKGRNIIAARVESRDSDWLNRLNNTSLPYDPSIQFFYEDGEHLIKIKESPVLEGLEDPFSTYIRVGGIKKLLLGGVRVNFQPKFKPIITTEIYLVDDIYDFIPNSPVAIVDGMKDVRFYQSVKDDLIMLTRPTTGKAYPGSIGFNRLTMEEMFNSEVLKQKVEEAVILKFSLKNVKLGPNAMYRCLVETRSGNPKELVRLLCHAATADPYTNKDGVLVENDFIYGDIHYKAYEGYLDPENTQDVIKLNLLAEASDFNLTTEDIKADRYKDVVFPGGILGGNLYLGIADRSIGKIPFSNNLI